MSKPLRLLKGTDQGAPEEVLASVLLVGETIAYQGDTSSWSERMISHTGSTTWLRLLHEAVVENFFTRAKA